MNSSIPIFLNSNAGAFSASLSSEQMLHAAREVDLDVQVVMPRTRREMAGLLQQFVIEKRERVVVAGGDGTVAIAAQVLAHTETALGIIPQGTFNNFATALRLPMDLPSALRVIGEGKIEEIDLGRVVTSNRAPRYFTEAAGVGLFADGLALYGKGSNKNFMRGLKAFTRVLLSLRARRLTLVLDGEEITQRILMCTCANTFRMAQGVPVAPGAKLTDDELDVIIVGDLSIGEILPYYRAFRTQTHGSLPKVQHLRAQKIRIQARRRINVHCDDAFVGLTPAIITSQAGALKVLREVI